MPKVTIRGLRGEHAGRVREIVEKHKKIRVKMHFSFYDPEKQKYLLMKGEHVTFDTSSVLFALQLPDKLREFLEGKS